MSLAFVSLSLILSCSSVVVNFVSVERSLLVARTVMHWTDVPWLAHSTLPFPFYYVADPFRFSKVAASWVRLAVGLLFGRGARAKQGCHLRCCGWLGEGRGCCPASGGCCLLLGWVLGWWQLGGAWFCCCLLDGAWMAGLLDSALRR